MCSPAGRIASCASCAFFTLPWYVRGASGRYSSPYRLRICSRAPLIAWSDRFVGSADSRLERALEIPVLGGPEGHARPFALDDEARGDALDPARRQPGHHLLPEDGRDLVADEPVEHPATLLRLDQLHVELAPVLDRVLDGGARDLVEDHAPHRDIGPEHLEHVPGDGLALAVLVGGEIELA